MSSAPVCPTCCAEPLVTTHVIEQDDKKQKTKDSDGFSKVDLRHNNPIASLDKANVNKYILYVAKHERKPPINMLPRSKHPKHNKLTVSRIRERAVIFLVVIDRNETFAPTRKLCLVKRIKICRYSDPLKPIIYI